MAVRKLKPVTPGQRHKVARSFDAVTSSKPQKSLLLPTKNSGGRNSSGKMTMQYIGGGHKRRYRIVDFKRNKFNIPARVASIEYDPNRTAYISLLHYKDGEKTGVWKSYYENGTVSQQASYLDGEFEGEFITYHTNGMTRIKGKYIEGNEDGSWRSYADSGELELIIKYQFGQRLTEIRINGYFEDTFVDGRTKTEYTYRNKLKDGPYRIFYDQGEYIIEAFIDSETGEQLQRRVLHGTQVSEEGNYVEGKLHGPVYHYSEKGALIKTVNYNMGEIVE